MPLEPSNNLRSSECSQQTRSNHQKGGWDQYLKVVSHIIQIGVSDLKMAEISEEVVGREGGVVKSPEADENQADQAAIAVSDDKVGTEIANKEHQKAVDHLQQHHMNQLMVFRNQERECPIQRRRAETPPLSRATRCRTLTSMT